MLSKIRAGLKAELREMLVKNQEKHFNNPLNKYKNLVIENLVKRGIEESIAKTLVEKYADSTINESLLEKVHAEDSVKSKANLLGCAISRKYVESLKKS